MSIHPIFMERSKEEPPKKLEALRRLIRENVSKMNHKLSKDSQKEIDQLLEIKTMEWVFLGK